MNVSLEDLPRVETIEVDSSPPALDLFSAKQGPVILKKMVLNWPVVQEGLKSPKKGYDYFKKFYNGGPVNAAVGEPSARGRVFYSEGFDGFTYQRERIKLDTLLDCILASSGCEHPSLYYADSVLIDRYLPGLSEENKLNIDISNARKSLWVGNKTVVSAHYDIPKNLACVVQGRRRFVLFPPEQLENLYVGPIDFNPAGPAISLVDLNHIDFNQYPKMKKALDSAFIAELEAGDALYIPGMWWHHVEGLDDQNAMINYWWDSYPPYTGSAQDALHHAFLSLKSLPKSEREIWKNIFNYYVFDYDEHDFSHIPDERKGIINDLTEDSARRLRAILLNRLNQ